MFVYKLVTSIETSIAFSGIFVFSMKLMKVVVSLRYEYFAVVQLIIQRPVGLGL